MSEYEFGINKINMCIKLFWWALSGKSSENPTRRRRRHYIVIYFIDFKGCVCVCDDYNKKEKNIYLNLETQLNMSAWWIMHNRPPTSSTYRRNITIYPLYVVHIYSIQNRKKSCFLTYYFLFWNMKNEF